MEKEKGESDKSFQKTSCQVITFSYPQPVYLNTAFPIFGHFKHMPIAQLRPSGSNLKVIRAMPKNKLVFSIDPFPKSPMFVFIQIQPR